MKLIACFLLIASTFICRAQQIFYPDPENSVGHLPVFYIDSIKMDSINNPLLFINPQLIKSISSKGNMMDKNGEVYITLKDRKVLDSLINHRWLSLQEILDKNVGESYRKSKFLFIWDNKLIVDTTNIRFPEHRITYVGVKKASELPYFKTAFPDVLIMLISTEPPVIYIRGKGKEQ